MFRALTILAAALMLVALPMTGAFQAEHRPHGVDDQTMSFDRSVVHNATGTVQDLYEPTVSVDANGTVYVSGHSIGADSTGTPAYVSHDGGGNWTQLPFLGPLAAPGPVQGSAPPPGDEGYIVPAENGRAYMVDINLATFPVVGWCGNGTSQCYYQPNALDRSTALQQEGNGCQALGATDRGWAAYANHTLLMVNNDGFGPVQVGVEHNMPPNSSFNPAPAKWNLCADPVGYIPGVPAIRNDGLYAVPHLVKGNMTVVLGTAGNLSRTVNQTLFRVHGNETNTSFGGGSNFGWASFDEEGALYVAGLQDPLNRTGVFNVSYSNDGGKTFTTSSFSVGSGIGFLWITGNPNGHGALVTWAQQAKESDLGTFYAAHLMPAGNGKLKLQDVSVVAKDVQHPCGDLMGSAVGPHGEAYVAVFGSAEGCTDTPLSNPLSVYVQHGGPTLPVGELPHHQDDDNPGSYNATAAYLNGSGNGTCCGCSCQGQGQGQSQSGSGDGVAGTGVGVNDQVGTTVESTVRSVESSVATLLP